MNNKLEKKILEFFERARLKPRPLQVETAIRVAEQLDSNPVGVGLEAPTGFGKTLVVLASLTSLNVFPVTWRVRTFEQAKRISNDCALANIPFYIGAGREKLCLVKDEYKTATPIFCRYLRFKCEYFKALSNVGSILAYDYEELSKRAKLKGACPYYAQRLLQNISVFVVPYNFGLSFDTQLEIFDEAHNLVLDLQSFPEEKLKEALALLGLDVDFPAGDTWSLNDKIFVEQIITKILEKLEQGQRPIVSPIIYSLLNAKLIWRDEGDITILRINSPKRRAIFVSATLEPLAKIFKIPVVKVPVERKPVAFILSWLTTRFRDFDAYMIKQYNDLIFLLRKNCEKVIVFATKRVGSKLNVDYVEEDSPRGVVLYYSRGRYSEGVNLEAQCILLAGAPFLPPYVPIHKLGLTYEDVAQLITVQNIGRVLRKPTSNPIIILADFRFLKIPLNNYYEIVEVKDLQELNNILQQRQQNSS